jgi:CheY-specific phosphatase CheX
MVSQIVGDYLVERGIMTSGQLLVIHKIRRRNRASLGMVAVSEGLMLPAEVMAINEDLERNYRLTDRTFAEKVVELGYLSESQVRALSVKQSDPYLCFVQALEKQNIIGIEALEQLMRESPLIKDEMHLEDLKSDDVSRIVPLFIPKGAEKYTNAAISALSFLNRKVSSHIYPIYPIQAYLTDKLEVANGVAQWAEGESEFFFALMAAEQGLSDLATCYVHERFEEVSEDVLEIVSEILSSIVVTYAAELSQADVLLDLASPQVYPKMQEISADEMLVMPLKVKGNLIDLVISTANNIAIK